MRVTGDLGRCRIRLSRRRGSQLWETESGTESPRGHSRVVWRPVESARGHRLVRQPFGRGRHPPDGPSRDAPARAGRHAVRVLFKVTAFARDENDIITPWLTETIERLHERGVEVEVLAPSYRGGGDHTIGRIRVHRFRYAPSRIETLTHDQTAPDRIRERPQYSALVPGYVAAGTLAARRLARTGRFDVVHSFWPLPHGIFGLAASRAGNIPLVCTFFGVELRWVRAQLPFFAPLMRTIIRNSDAITAISGHTAAEVRRLVPDAEMVTVPFGAAIAPDAKAEEETHSPKLAGRFTC